MVQLVKVFSYLVKNKRRLINQAINQTITYNANSILITLNENKTRAILKGRGGLKYEFIAGSYGKDWISMNEPIKPIKEQAIANFLLSTQQRVPGFLFALASSVAVGSSDFKILSQDKEFMNATKKVKKQIR